jgi:hypothetical protein
MAEEKKRYESGAVVAAVLGVAAGLGLLAVAAAAAAAPKKKPASKPCTTTEISPGRFRKKCDLRGEFDDVTFDLGQEALLEGGPVSAILTGHPLNEAGSLTYNNLTFSYLDGNKNLVQSGQCCVNSPAGTRCLCNLPAPSDPTRRVRFIEVISFGSTSPLSPLGPVKRCVLKDVTADIIFRT